MVQGFRNSNVVELSDIEGSLEMSKFVTALRTRLKVHAKSKKFTHNTEFLDLHNEDDSRRFHGMDDGEIARIDLL